MIRLWPGLPLLLTERHDREERTHLLLAGNPPEAGYLEVETPTMFRRELWETSGHWEHYKENMYTTKIDDKDFAIKPMNCPGAMLGLQ
jgi:threonyl-tRNA synthetase